jgi:ABC-type multidrug transport system fused ATPase/permease subunit
VRVVRDFGAQSLVVGNFSEGNLNLLKLREKIARIISFQLPLISVMGQVAIGVLLFWVAQTDEAEALNIGQIAAYIAYLAMLTSVLFQTGWMLNAIQRGLISLKRIDAVMPIEASFEESETKTFDPKDMGDPDLGIKVENLSLTLDEKVILEKIDLKVLPGQHIGILGTVGSGKSTLASIITGQTKDFEGNVSLHGISVHELDVEAIGSAIRLVPDLPFLFTQQLNENVAFNQAKETIDHKGVNKALHVAAFDPQSENLVHGVETLVGEKGIALSGGQKQRITLARAIYAGGTVLILDDVLSAVDHQTEHKILERLEGWRLSQGKNVALINISNRVSALESADEVLVLDQGHIVERGRPEELAKGKGLYATTRNLQRAISDSQNEGSGK